MGEHLVAFLVLPLAAYLVGSVPFGLLIGMARGVDVRSKGSGNIGATNVWRLLGSRLGSLCFVLDVLKGLVVVVGAGFYLRGAGLDGAVGLIGPLGQLAWISVGAGSILGHMFSIYLRFGGGKGGATSFGVLVGIWPYVTMTGVGSCVIWIVVWGVWRYASVASMAAAVGFPMMFLLLIRQVDGWRFEELWPLFVFSCVIAGLVVVRHRSNIRRLLAGTEDK